ncbi:hypothetical protein DPMN_101354 [Dreissena polymorpha]|uniref:SRCR domain-containing protein n=1 Tax=Dreissena polymorpha TaxID=45954 RepID=A0A9D4LHD4_DREPO|nr:hypothetical protein DPMN_101354 [Dreissena polymorpha]
MWLNHFNVFIGWLILSAFQTVSATSIRLVGGKTPYSGRLEVEHDGQWGTVCDDEFTANSAKIVCKMLGFTDTGSAHVVPTSLYGPSGGTILLDSLACVGNETDIAGCSHQDWGVTDCTHNEDISIDCRTPIRLVNGTSEQSGRVEVLHRGEWGTICDYNFDDRDAKVICRMLGFVFSRAKSLSGAYYGEGQGRIAVDELYCQGEETDISECKSRPWGSNNICTHSEDAAVECSSELRLYDGPTEFSGRLELRRESTWKTVCADHFDNRTAQVVCNMLGFERGNISVYSDERFPAGSDAQMNGNGYVCMGNETDIANCKHYNVSLPCNAVAINCYSNTPVRLVDGTNMFNGRVEIYETFNSSNGDWKGLCYDNLTKEDAVVLCKMLGLSTPTPTIHDAYDQYNRGGLFSLLSGLGCNGSETDISGCAPQHKWNNDICLHSRHAAINCAPNSKLRLYNGSSIKSGRVEVLYNGSWLHVCRHSDMDRREFDLICQQLGFNQSGYQLVSMENIVTKGIRSLECRGAESDISDCRSGQWDVVGYCIPETIACNSTVRLINGSSERSGRVEVLNQGKWGTICADGFDITEANVVCRKAGIRLWNASVLPGSPFGKGSAESILGNVSCKGNESDLSECNSSPWKLTKCGKEDVATVDCRVQNTPLRLVGGKTKYSGRVELFYEGTWRSYCHEYNTQHQENLELLCQLLGYNYSSYARYLDYVYLNGMSLFHDLSCNGNESDISLCPSSDWGNYSCSYYTAIDCLSPIELIGGLTDYMGFVKINSNFLCADNLTGETQAVLCNMLGYSFTSDHALTDKEHFRPAFSHLNMVDDIICSGDEKDYQLCRPTDWNRGNCSSGRPAYVHCNTPVRLRDRANIYNGTVEIYQNATCNSLTSYGSIPSNSNSSVSMNCTGNEADVSQCRSVQNVSCSHIITVKCPTDISLANGKTKYMGALAVQTGSRTTRIRSFINDTLKTVCRLLGFNLTRSIELEPSNEFLRNKFETAGEVIRELYCQGNETDIAECTESTVDSYVGQWESGINCQTAIRLTDGEPYIHGVLQMKFQETWYNTCADGFTLNDGFVVCRMLGHRHVSNVVVTQVSGKKVAFNGNLRCTGNEVDISKCPGYNYFLDNCSSNQGLRIDCRTKVRLVDGLNTKGRVEVFYNGTWGHVCTDWGNQDSVLCRSAGFSYTYGSHLSQMTFSNKSIGNSTAVFLQCTGYEKSITECNWNPRNGINEPCNSMYPLEIECNTHVSLKPGISKYSGWIAVDFLDPDLYSTQYASVCGEQFDLEEADIFCKAIGSPTERNATIIKNNKYGSHYNFVIAHLDCVGNETDVRECRSDRWSENHNSCNASDTNVAINCQPKTLMRMQGKDRLNGLVEIFFDAQWYTMCGDGFGVREAAVVCHNLGYKVGIPQIVFNSNSSLIYKMDCAGNETDISQCEFRTRSWVYNEYPWTPGDCSSLSHDVHQRVRLVSDVNNYQGRVEFQYLGVWGTVCSENFTQNDARLVCKLGGYSGQSNITIHNSTKYGRGDGALVVDNLLCDGDESDLDQCDSYPWTKNTTNQFCLMHAQDAGVNCRPETPMRLAGGTVYSGRVEIEYEGTWGTICDKEFDDVDAKVICRMKGFNTESLIVLRNGFYGHGNGNVIISNLACRGDESDISECDVGYRTSSEKARWGNPSELCSHANDVAIQCNTPVRLREGWTFYSGIAEVFLRGQWRRICRDNFTTHDAEALCKLSGKRENYSGNITIHTEQYLNADFKESQLGGFGCTGHENDLYECGSGRWVWNYQPCPSEQNVALNCRATTNVRLMNGLKEAANNTLPLKGRVEIKYTQYDDARHRDNHWGTICDDQFGDDDALVLCSMMGYSVGRVYRPDTEYESFGNETILLDDLQCLGNEADVSECKAREWGTHDCVHDEDVSISCNYQNNIDPCDKENYKRLPNLEMRLVNYITKSNPINDNKLSLDWYYVGNNTLPDKEPPFNRCSTVFPIYSKDLSAIPTMVDKIKSFKAEQSRDSSITYDLQVKNCGGYFVYRLGPTVTTNSGYCFGIGSESPPPSFVVNSVGVVYNETGTSIWFKCKFAPDIASNLYYQVEWHVMGNSEHITTKQYCSQSDMSPCFLSSKDLADMNVGMGTNISCGVRAFNEPVGQPGRLSVISDPFFLGIKLSTPRISLRRGEVKFVEMKLTVPIVCEDTWPTNNIKCIVNIDYFTPDYGSCPNAEGSFPGGCSTEITATTFGETIRVSVSAAETGQYGVAGKFNMFLQIPRTRGVAFLSVPYKLPAIEVEVLPESDRQWRGKLCTARNDPHMYTFDGRSYEHHAKEGDYILYRHSVYGNVEIQHRIANCTDGNNPAKCNCGVAVRAGRDVYVINVCNGYIDIGYRQCSDKALTVKKENDYTYTIYLPYGTAVRARIDNAPFMGRDGGRRPYVRHRRSVAEEDLSKLCEDHFRTIQNMCKKIPHTHTNVSVENCVLDIKLTNTTDWISMSKQSMLDTCQNEIRRNSTVIKDIITKAEANSTTASGNVNTTETAQANIAELTALREILSTSQTIKDSFCMNSCSGNGTCKQGTCECNIGFGATDCSIDLVTPPKIVGLLDHGLCDENKTDCSQIVVFGGEFASSNLTCRLRTFYFDIHRTVHNGITSTVPGHAETIVETLCPIRGLRLRRSAENMFVMGFHVSVSNDGQHFNDTNQGIAYIYNSECQTHTYTNHTEFMSSFSLKDDYCFIEGKCYFNGTFHASQIMICDPSVNASSWTTYQPLPKPILDCSNPEACKQKNHSVCEVKNGTPLCSCIRGFTQNQTDGLKCEQTSDIHVTDKVLDDDKGSLLIELKLDYNLPTTVTLNSSITYTKYENEVHDELMKFYRGQLGNRLAKVIIKDIRPGSLIVDHLVVYFQRAQILSDVTQVVDELSRHRLTISGTECPVIGVALGKEKVPVIEPKVDLCRLYKIIHPCNEDEVCETNNIGTSCVKKETHRDENGVSKLMVIVSSVIGGILFLVIVVLVFIVCKKRAKKPMALDRMEPKVHDNTYQDINLREMSVLSVGSTDVYRIPRAKLSGSQLAFQRGLGDARRDHLYERRRSETNEHPYG